jgi:hypothetical protein
VLHPCCGKFSRILCEESAAAWVSPTFSAAVPSSVHGSPVVLSEAPPISPMVTKGTEGKDQVCA